MLCAEKKGWAVMQEKQMQKETKGSTTKVVHVVKHETHFFRSLYHKIISLLFLAVIIVIIYVSYQKITITNCIVEFDHSIYIYPNNSADHVLHKSPLAEFLYALSKNFDLAKAQEDLNAYVGSSAYDVVKDDSDFIKGFYFQDQLTNAKTSLNIDENYINYLKRPIGDFISNKASVNGIVGFLNGLKNLFPGTTIEFNLKDIKDTKINLDLNKIISPNKQINAGNDVLNNYKVIQVKNINLYDNRASAVCYLVNMKPNYSNNDDSTIYITESEELPTCTVYLEKLDSQWYITGFQKNAGPIKNSWIGIIEYYYQIPENAVKNIYHQISYFITQNMSN